MILNDRFRHFVYMCLITTYVFCQESPNASYDLSVPLDEKSELYKIGHKIVYEWRCDEKGQCNQPSFKCDNESRLNDIELEICSKADEWFRGFTSIILYDNFFTSYYHLIMQHTPKDKQQEVKRIAKEAMKKREYISKCSKEFTSSAGIQMCSHDYIGAAYEYGIQELSKYVSIHNPKLLDSIFLQYAKEVENIKVEYDKAELLDKLYIDRIINETGKLIVRVDSDDKTE